MFDNIKRAAIISDNGLYRYTLSRIWDETKPRLTWLMLNPSTADANKDDTTTKQCIFFSHREGYGGIIIVNLFAFRTTYPRLLKTIDNPIGPYNDAWINIAASNNNIICAWGNEGRKQQFRIKQVLEILQKKQTHMFCLGLTKLGQPRHPCRLPHNTKFMEWLPNL